MVLRPKNEIYEIVIKKNTRVSWFAPDCRIQKPAKFGFDKTSNCHNFCIDYQNLTYYMVLG